MAQAKKNASVKAFQSHTAKEKKFSARTLLEWEIAFNTNNKRGHVYDQSEINSLYARDSWECEHGASKTCHLVSHMGRDFKYIVIKRHQTGGYIPNAHREHAKCTGNQLIDEIACWQEFAETEHADLLCPVLKFFTSKSDKVGATSETMQKNVVIIAQRALKVGDAAYMCRKAESMNAEHGYKGESYDERYAKMSALSRMQGWRDAMHNGGNSGVIFDYAKGCYKAVFIDYAL